MKRPKKQGLTSGFQELPFRTGIRDLQGSSEIVARDVILGLKFWHVSDTKYTLQPEQQTPVPHVPLTQQTIHTSCEQDWSGQSSRGWSGVDTAVQMPCSPRPSPLKLSKHITDSSPLSDPSVAEMLHTITTAKLQWRCLAPESYGVSINPLLKWLQIPKPSKAPLPSPKQMGCTSPNPHPCEVGVVYGQGSEAERGEPSI